MNLYALLADFVVVVHAAYAAFVIIGLLLIVLGTALRWEWVRGFWFRTMHLVAIAFVCVESLIGASCPLTLLENRLRVVAGERGYPRDFIGYWSDRLLFYDFPPRFFTLAYLTVGFLVAAAFVLAPPRPPRSRTTS
jgi:hypothetical protein